jgi:hypothetical protein
MVPNKKMEIKLQKQELNISGFLSINNIGAELLKKEVIGK